MSINRRHFVKGGLSGILANSLRAAVTGVPLSFLTSGTVSAAGTGSPRFLVIATSDRGEPLNIYGPGSFSSKANDAASRISHADLNIAPAEYSRVINGIKYNAIDFNNGANLSLGKETVKAARVWGALNQGMRDNLVSFWHNTNVNGHSEYRDILSVNLAMKDAEGGKSEHVAAAIAQELSPLLGTATNTPVVLGNGPHTTNGVPLNNYRASSLKLAFDNNNSLVAPSGFSALYTSTVNKMFKEVKSNGTSTQMKFLDQHIASRQEAISLGDQMGELLSKVGNGNTALDQMTVALAMFKAKLTPVVVVKSQWGGDNHAGRNVYWEVEQTLESIDTLNKFYDLANSQGMGDQIAYAELSIFGRTAKLSKKNGGRDHSGKFTNGLIYGTNLRGGMVGGLQPFRNDEVETSALNSTTGGTDKPDVAQKDTFESYIKTMMLATGVPEDRCDVRMPNGKIVRSIFA